MEAPTLKIFVCEEITVVDTVVSPAPAREYADVPVVLPRRRDTFIAKDSTLNWPPSMARSPSTSTFDPDTQAAMAYATPLFFFL